jgi:ABC-type antimicrobial peptide transport system permease subunit
LGTVIGISVAFWSTRMMASILYGISPSDSISFLTGSCLVVAVALAASYIPARQATKVTPAIALRHY